MKRLAGWLAALAIVAWALLGLDLHAARIGAAGAALGDLAQRMWPPDGAVLPAAWAGLVETLQIAILATAIGLTLSLPLALMATRVIMPAAVAVPVRLVAAAVRVLPSLLWAILAVLVFGPGPLAGVVAMAFYTIGYLAKLQAESFDGLARDPLEAMHATGATRFQLAWHVVVPESQNALRSQALFMLEYNLRASSIIGIVGAGGIGQVLSTSLRFYEYDRILTVLLLLFATVVAFDAASHLVRRRYLELDGPRASWADLLTPWR